MPNSEAPSETKLIIQFNDEIKKAKPNYISLIRSLINYPKSLPRVDFISKMLKENTLKMETLFRRLLEGVGLNKTLTKEGNLLIDDFIDQASNFNIVSDSKGNNHIFSAVAHGRTKLVEAILHRNENSVNAVSKIGSSPIHIASKNRSTEVLNIILRCPRLDFYKKYDEKKPIPEIFRNKTALDLAWDKCDALNANTFHTLLKEHQRRLNLRDPDAIAYEQAMLKEKSPNFNPIGEQVSQSSSSISGPISFADAISLPPHKITTSSSISSQNPGSIASILNVPAPQIDDRASSELSIHVSSEEREIAFQVVKRRKTQDEASSQNRGEPSQATIDQTQDEVSSQNRGAPSQATSDASCVKLGPIRLL
jgi:hypothetical protein